MNLQQPRVVRSVQCRSDGSGSVWKTKNVFFAKLCVWLGVLCGFALYFTSYRKVRKGFRKERKARLTHYPLFDLSAQVLTLNVVEAMKRVLSVHYRKSSLASSGK